MLFFLMVDSQFKYHQQNAKNINLANYSVHNHCQAPEFLCFRSFLRVAITPYSPLQCFYQQAFHKTIISDVFQ